MMQRIADNLERRYKVRFYFHVQFFLNDIHIIFSDFMWSIVYIY